MCPPHHDTPNSGSPTAQHAYDELQTSTDIEAELDRLKAENARFARELGDVESDEGEDTAATTMEAEAQDFTHDDSSTETDDQHTALKKKVKALETELGAKALKSWADEATNIVLKEKIKALEAEREELKTEAGELKSNVAELKAENGALKGELEDTKVQLRNKIHHVQGLRRRRDSLKSELEDTRGLLEDMKTNFKVKSCIRGIASGGYNEVREHGSTLARHSSGRCLPR